MSRQVWLGCAAAAAVFAGLAGCSAGGRGTPSGPVKSADAFEAALTSGDTSAACALLAPPTRTEVEQSAQGQGCPKALRQQKLPAARPGGDLQVFGDEAILQAPGDVLFLTNVSGRWLVSAAGCTPRQDQPYDCEVKA